MSRLSRRPSAMIAIEGRRNSFGIEFAECHVVPSDAGYGRQRSFATCAAAKVPKIFVGPQRSLR